MISEFFPNLNDSMILFPCPSQLQCLRFATPRTEDTSGLFFSKWFGSGRSEEEIFSLDTSPEKSVNGAFTRTFAKRAFPIHNYKRL